MAEMADELPSRDPFHAARTTSGVLRCPFQGESVPMILRHAEVRAAARDWSTFSSDAPFRVPIPSEEAVRTMRQLPIETNPPEHTDYRAIVEPFFQRAKLPEVAHQVEALIGRSLTAVIGREAFEVVADFALPVQSRALTYLLNVPESEADIWIGWGIHVFKVTGGAFKQGTVLEDYLRAKFDAVTAQPGDDFFSALTRATYHGRPLALTFLREDPRRIVHAGEEFFRFFMPLTHIGRVCPAGAEVQGEQVPPNGRVALAWAAANFDETVFTAPHEVQLDRKPNPHLSFGFGPHLCLGAAHARLIVRSFLQALVERVAAIEVIAAVEHIEREPAYQRINGFDSLTVRLVAR